MKHTNVPASYLILMQDSKILLLRRSNTGYEDGMYSFVAGHVEESETFTQCVIREAKEEAGIIVKSEDIEVAHVMHRKCTPDEKERIDVFFVAKRWEGEIVNMEPHKCDDLSWFDLNHMPPNVIPYISFTIKKILAGKTYSEYWHDDTNLHN